jgi:LIN37
MPDLLTNYLSGAVKEINELPKPKEPLDDVSTKAPLLEFQKPSPEMMEALDKHMKFLDTPIDKKTLIKDNLGRWKLVKKHNLDHAKRLEERFEPSLKLIKALYKA